MQCNLCGQHWNQNFGGRGKLVSIPHMQRFLICTLQGKLDLAKIETVVNQIVHLKRVGDVFGKASMTLSGQCALWVSQLLLSHAGDDDIWIYRRLQYK